MAVTDPLSNDLYVVPKAQIFFKKAGATEYENLGDADSLTLEIAVEEQERYANDRGIRTLVKRTVTQTSATISMTLAQMSAFARAASLMADADTVDGTEEVIDLGGEILEIQSGGHKSGVASNPTLRGELVIRGVNAEGPKSLLRLWDVEIRPASARSFISDTEIATIELSGAAYPAAGKSAGYEIGEELTITGNTTPAGA